MSATPSKADSLPSWSMARTARRGNLPKSEMVNSRGLSTSPLTRNSMSPCGRGRRAGLPKKGEGTYQDAQPEDQPHAPLLDHVSVPNFRIKVYGIISRYTAGTRVSPLLLVVKPTAGQHM
jgi:hypothetical protein